MLANSIWFPLRGELLDREGFYWRLHYALEGKLTRILHGKLGFDILVGIDILRVFGSFAMAAALARSGRDRMEKPLILPQRLA
jgi:hypothetical protein